MGTRADFYVGRGKYAEWLGSVAYDGYDAPKKLLRAVNEAVFRDEVFKHLDKNNDHSTIPDMGWPWPWEDSATTDYTYAFDEGRVWASCFGNPWRKGPKSAGEAVNGDKPIFPNMKDRMKVALGSRSGLMIISN